MSWTVKFSNGQLLEVEDQDNLSECTDITSAPILYGCRTGICSTCLVNVKTGSDNITPSSEDEAELLSIIAPEQPNARLACQFKILGDIELEYIGK